MSAATFFTLERACFLLAITIPFDIRDMKADKAANLATIPLRIGESKSILLSVGLILLFAGLVAVHYPYSGVMQWPHLLALEASALITALILWRTDSNRGAYWFSLLVAGTMVIQFLLIFGFDSVLG